MNAVRAVEEVVDAVDLAIRIHDSLRRILRHPSRSDLVKSVPSLGQDALFEVRIDIFESSYSIALQMVVPISMGSDHAVDIPRTVLDIDINAPHPEFIAFRAELDPALRIRDLLRKILKKVAVGSAGLEEARNLAANEEAPVREGRDERSGSREIEDHIANVLRRASHNLGFQGGLADRFRREEATQRGCQCEVDERENAIAMARIGNIGVHEQSDDIRQFLPALKICVIDPPSL